MALVNTKRAFYKELQITRTQGGVPSVLTHSILDAIPGTSFGAINEPDFAQLTLLQAQTRYAAFESYLFTNYPGFTATDITNQSIVANSPFCQI